MWKITENQPATDNQPQSRTCKLHVQLTAGAQFDHSKGGLRGQCISLSLKSLDPVIQSIITAGNPSAETDVHDIFHALSCPVLSTTPCHSWRPPWVHAVDVHDIFHALSRPVLSTTPCHSCLPGCWIALKIRSIQSAWPDFACVSRQIYLTAGLSPVGYTWFSLPFKAIKQGLAVNACQSATLWVWILSVTPGLACQSKQLNKVWLLMHVHHLLGSWGENWMAGEDQGPGSSSLWSRTCCQWPPSLKAPCLPLTVPEFCHWWLHK